ncbi:disulfide bond formation protein B [Pseudooceanicola sp. CBS1P-1]|uniref:Putative protein-disulfide oxidoreductase DsbI n=1 Tax=Pseudooceanicola albus TaxID=2692189 RepID=A0A6L7G404_9RHOB|nr:MULTISPECIES: disulfide bond formation protein B [Pseudooceanicola]MBT9383507.1 disulfide bond formation protein B [Pseudooceanicola endophyticus]MXN17363.1 disulfide bond formation protein B [Pseudooceanicola albus]
MTYRQTTLLAAAGSAALLLGALGFQYIGGLAPCHLCMEQRYPHVVAVVLGLIAALTGWRWIAPLGALAALTTAGIGIYHTLVERHIVAGPTTCTSGDISTMSSDSLFDQIMTAPLVQCDQVAWSMWGISMASWNALFSLLLVAIWIAAWRRRA